MAEQRPHLIVIEQLQGARVDDDEGTVHPERAGVDKRGLRHEQLRPRVPVHRREDVGIQLVETGELFRADPHGVGLEQQANPALTDEARDLFDDEVEARDRTERL